MKINLRSNKIIIRQIKNDKNILIKYKELDIINIFLIVFLYPRNCLMKYRG